MDPEPDILPTKHCSTDTAGGKAEELFSPSLSHMFVCFLLKSWMALFPLLILIVVVV